MDLRKPSQWKSMSRDAVESLSLATAGPAPPLRQNTMDATAAVCYTLLQEVG